MNEIFKINLSLFSFNIALKLDYDETSEYQFAL